MKILVEIAAEGEHCRDCSACGYDFRKHHSFCEVFRSPLVHELKARSCRRCATCIAAEVKEEAKA